MLDKRPEATPRQDAPYTVEYVSVDQLPLELRQQLATPQGRGEPEFIATSGWGEITPPQAPMAGQVYDGYSPDIPHQFGYQTLPASKPGLTRRLREYAQDHKKATATAVALVLGASAYVVHERGSNQAAIQTITTPHHDKQAVVPTAKPNAVVNIAPDKVPDFPPQNVSCTDIANIGVNSTIPVDWSAVLYGKNNAKVWFRSNNSLTNSPITIAGTSNIKWQVCLAANSATPDASGNPTKNITVTRKDPTSMQNVAADMSKAVLIAYPQLDPATTSVAQLPQDYLLAALQQKDPANAPQDLNQFNGVWQSNKSTVLAADTNYLITQSYEADKDQLVKDARQAVKAALAAQAKAMGIPDDKIAISTASGDIPDPTTPYSQAAQVTPDSAFNIRFDDPQKIQTFTYTTSPLIASQ